MHKQVFPVQEQHLSTGMSQIKYVCDVIMMPLYGKMLMHSGCCSPKQCPIDSSKSISIYGHSHSLGQLQALIRSLTYAEWTKAYFGLCLMCGAGLLAEVPGSNSSSGAHHWSLLWQPLEARGQCVGQGTHAEHHALPHQRGHLPLCCLGHSGLILSQAHEAECVR